MGRPTALTNVEPCRLTLLLFLPIFGARACPSYGTMSELVVVGRIKLTGLSCSSISVMWATPSHGPGG